MDWWRKCAMNTGGRGGAALNQTYWGAIKGTRNNEETHVGKYWAEGRRFVGIIKGGIIIHLHLTSTHVIISFRPSHHNCIPHQLESTSRGLSPPPRAKLTKKDPPYRRSYSRRYIHNAMGQTRATAAAALCALYMYSCMQCGRGK